MPSRIISTTLVLVYDQKYVGEMMDLKGNGRDSPCGRECLDYIHVSITI